MTGKEKLYQRYYQPDCLWVGDKAIKKLHEIMSRSKKDLKTWLAKQVFWHAYIPPRKEINHPHYDVTKPNGQHQLDILYMPHNFLKETRASIS